MSQLFFGSHVHEHVEAKRELAGSIMISKNKNDSNCLNVKDESPDVISRDLSRHRDDWRTSSRRHVKPVNDSFIQSAPSTRSRRVQDGRLDGRTDGQTDAVLLFYVNRLTELCFSRLATRWQRSDSLHLCLLPHCPWNE